MNGIILKSGLKIEVGVVTSGELVFTTDSNELLANGLKARKVVPEEFPLIIKTPSLPTIDGELGDYAINTAWGEHIDYYYKDQWVPRYEGYSVDYLNTHFEPKVNYPLDLIKRDGSTPFVVGFDNSSLDSFVSKQDADFIVDNMDFDDYISTDGTDEMISGYVPFHPQDVINLKYLHSGKYILIPPTTKPLTPGTLWNDNGTPRLTDRIDYFELIITSPVQPTFTSIGGDITVEDNYNGTFKCYSHDSLTNFRTVDKSAIRVQVIEFPKSLVSLESAFENCVNLSSFVCPFYEMSKVQFLNRTWASCSGLTSFPLVDTSSVTNFYAAWVGCSGLTSFPLIDTTVADSFTGTWQGCSGLTSFPPLLVPIADSFLATWAGCSGLTSFPFMSAPNAGTMRATWHNCTSLPHCPFGVEFIGGWGAWDTCYNV